MNESNGSLESLIQQKIDGDTDFQAELETLTDDSERESKISERRKVLVEEEYASISAKAKEGEKAKELADNYKIRAEKAEALAKSKGGSGGEAAPKTGELTQNDLLALVRNNVPEEDIDEIVDFAKLKKISVSEALKTPLVKGILAEKEETRKSADAANVNGGRKGSSRVTSEKLIQDATKGILPESEEDMIRLVKARKGIK